MFEKVNPEHPDKVMDRIAGAIVDLAYTKEANPKIAVEGVIGHDHCDIVIESSCFINIKEVETIVGRIAGGTVKTYVMVVPQDVHLSNNQNGKIKCGDNGIFKGVPVTEEQSRLTNIAKNIYDMYKTDGKYILDGERLIICQSNADERLTEEYPSAIINPLGDWTGGIRVDTGAVNRKLGSDMGDSVTGGGLHGKDLSKADVSINIYAWLKAQETGKNVEICCAIGDEIVDGKPYSEIVAIAKEFIKEKGGFEKFAEWGLIG